MQSVSTPDPGTTPDTTRADRPVLFTLAGLFLLLALAGSMTFLAPPAFVAAILTTAHALSGGAR